MISFLCVMWISQYLHIKTKKKEFIKGQLEEKIGKPKELWKTLKSIGLSKKPSSDTNICLKDGEKLSFTQKLMQIPFVKCSLI